MPSRICRFLTNCSPEDRERYIRSAPFIIIHPEIVRLIQSFSPERIPELELEFAKFLFTKGAQKDITDWILNTGK